MTNKERLDAANRDFASFAIYGQTCQYWLQQANEHARNHGTEGASVEEYVSKAYKNSGR